MHDLLWAPQFCNDYSLILEFLPRVLAKEKWYTHIDWYPETPLKKSFSALIKLVRFQEYGYFILITSLLGAVTAGGILSDRLLAILLANGSRLLCAWSMILKMWQKTFSLKQLA